MNRPQRRKPLLSEPGIPLSPLPPPVQAAQGLWRFAVPLLLGAYLILAGLHAAWVPTGQTGYQNAPDEAAHVRYIQTLVTGHLPTQAEAALDASGQSYEWHQPPLYYAWAALFLPLGMHGMRLASIVLGLAAILLVFQSARTLFPDDPLLGIVATGIAALLSTHIAITSTVNNDVLLECLFSATLLLLMQCFLRGLTTWRAGWIGIVVGAALLTKATGLLLLPVVGLSLLLMRRAGETWADALRSAAVILAWALAISGWWYARNLRLYGEILPLKAFERAFAGTALAKDMLPIFGGPVPYIQRVALWTGKSFWAVFGNASDAHYGMPRFLPDQVYILPLILVVASLIGMLRLHFIRNKAFSEAQLRTLWALMTTLALVALSFVLFLTKYFQTQGRYLYPAMLPICLLLAMGWQSLFPESRKSLAAGCFLGVLILIALLFMTSVQAASLN